VAIPSGPSPRSVEGTSASTRVSARTHSVQSVTTHRPDVPRLRVIGDLDPTNMGDPAGELGLFRGCRTVADLRAVLRQQVEVEVAAMSASIADADAFDVIELQRMRELPPVPDPRVVMPDGSGVVVEIVAAILLARPSRKPDPTPRPETRPHEQTSMLHQRAQRLIRLVTYYGQFEAKLSQDPLAHLAADYRSAVMGIRNMQYDVVRDDHEAQLFEHPVVAKLMATHLGYSYRDVVRVRDAMSRIAGDRMTRLRDETGAIIMRHHGVAPEDVPLDERQAFMDRMIPFMFLPADRARITVADVATSSGLEPTVARAVLDSYAQEFDTGTTAAQRVLDVLVGENPFLTAPLVTDGEGGFVATANDVGLDSLRRVVEAALPTNSEEVRRYDKKARQPVSEGIALQHLATILGHSPDFARLDYYAPKAGNDWAVMGADCTDLNEFGDVVEADGLFVIDDVAICVEMKAKSVAPQARRGDVKRLSRDLRATIGDGCSQTARLQSLIETNGGIWLQSKTWHDLSHVREVRSVLVLLDDVGPLGTNLGELARVGVIPTERPAWITSLHDLATIAQVSYCPGEFLLYLRRRTDSDVRRRFEAVDELDLYMLFFQGGLYIAPDPDATRTMHPAMPPVRNRDRREHARDDIPTMVNNHCQPLDAWMQRHRIEEHNEPATKPMFVLSPEIRPLIGALNANRPPGWLRACADVLSMSTEGQRDLAKGVAETSRRARRDGEYHDSYLSLAGAWGHPTFFVAVRPGGVERPAAQERLLTYMSAKRHQVGSDRAYGLMFDTRQNLEYVAYINSPLEADPDLDALGVAMELRPVGGATLPPVPPSARRATRRLRGRRTRR